MSTKLAELYRGCVCCSAPCIGIVNEANLGLTPRGFWYSDRMEIPLQILVVGKNPGNAAPESPESREAARLKGQSGSTARPCDRLRRSTAQTPTGRFSPDAAKDSGPAAPTGRLADTGEIDRHYRVGQMRGHRRAGAHPGFDGQDLCRSLAETGGGSLPAANDPRVGTGGGTGPGRPSRRTLALASRLLLSPVLGNQKSRRD